LNSGAKFEVARRAVRLTSNYGKTVKRTSCMQNEYLHAVSYFEQREKYQVSKDEISRYRSKKEKRFALF
jgi:hypothetical protein